MDKCNHPQDKRESYHDNSVLCTKCNCVIEQFGQTLSPPSRLSMMPTLSESSTSPGCYSPEIKALIEAAKQMPRETLMLGGCATEHDYKITGGQVWALDKALKALGE